MARPRTNDTFHLIHQNTTWRIVYYDATGRRKIASTGVIDLKGQEQSEQWRQAYEIAKKMYSDDYQPFLRKKAVAVETFGTYASVFFVNPETCPYCLSRKRKRLSVNKATLKFLKTGLDGVLVDLRDIQLSKLTKKVILDYYEKLLELPNHYARYRALQKVLFFLSESSGIPFKSYLPTLSAPLTKTEKQVISSNEYRLMRDFELSLLEKDFDLFAPENKELLFNWVMCLTLHETGLRLSELRALKKSDIIFESMSNRNFDEVMLEIKQGNLKSSSNMLCALKIDKHFTLKEREPVEGTKAGKDKKRIVNIRLELAGLLLGISTEQGYIFPFGETAITERFKKFMGKITEYKNLTPHCARHFVQTFLQGKVESPIIDIFLGHSRGRVKDTYFHRNFETCRKIPEVFKSF